MSFTKNSIVGTNRDPCKKYQLETAKEDPAHSSQCYEGGQFKTKKAKV